MASITQYRGKTWRAVVKRKGFPSTSQTFALKKDAEAWAAGIEAKMGVSEFDPLQMRQAKITTVSTLFERYRDEVAAKMKGRNEHGTVKRLIRDADFMNIRLDKLKHSHIRDWRDARAKTIKPQSVDREMHTISGVFTHAIKEWSAPLSTNPCHSVSQLSVATKSRDKRWNAEDTALFLKTCEWSEDAIPKVGRDFVGWALVLAIDTAMRIGELCMLTVADFYPDSPIGAHIHLNDTKNGEQRNVPLSSKAIRYFKHLCKDRAPEEKIFRINANTMGEYVLEVRRKCNLEHLVFHDTRHEAATRLSKRLSNVLELSAVTGHKSLQHLKKYYNPTPAELGSKLD